MRCVVKNIFLAILFSLPGLLPSFAAQAGVTAPSTESQPSKTVTTIEPSGSSDITAPAITPHRALYLIKLAGTRNGSKVNDLSGRMLFSWGDDCHAWNIEQKMQLRFFYSEGETSDTDRDLISHEAKDGSSYDFHVRRSADDKETPETFRGYASLKPGNDGEGSGEAVYSGDNEKRMALSGMMFPAHHTMQLLEHARKGDKFFAVNVFDGADETGYNEISSFISAPIEPKVVVEKTKAGDIAKDNPLLKVRAWPIRMAFFAPNSETGSPDYEMDMVLLDNGIIKSMTIDYGDFSMNADLVDVKPVSAPKCGMAESIPHS